ncbi:MAG: ATP-binding protein [bacterium]|nr:ATP-binding protein [bacterium]
MSFSDFLPLFSAIFVLFLGLLVFLKNKKSRVNFTFFLHSLAIIIWLIGTFMMFISKENKDTAIFWDRFVYAGVIFIPAFMYHFGLAYTKRKADILLYIAYGLSIIFLLFSRTQYFVNDLFIYKWGVHSKAQILHHLFLMYFFCYVIVWFLMIYKYYKNLNSPISREQTKYIFIAFLLLFTIGPIAYLPAYGIGIYPFAYISGLMFTIILAYAIIKHRLMDIKFVLRKSSVYLASLSTIIISAIAVKYIAIIFFSGISDQLDYLILISAVMVFLPIRNYYYKIANKYFFTSLYDSRKVIGKLSDKLRSTLEARKIYKYIADILMDSFHTKAVGILMQDKNKKRNKKQEEDQYILRYNNGFHIHGRKKFPGNKQLCNLFLKHNKSIIVEEIKRTDYKKFKNTIDLLTAFGAEIVTPLNIKGKVIGLIILSRKESGDMYNDQDLRVLEIVGAQAAIAIENAVLYEAAKNFNVKLKKEVEEATVELRAANEELKRLDVAKSEFISIASHQLRTPLTIIKGYISMLIEGSFGRLTDKETGALKKVFESNERLIQLVEDLLDISRIESGSLRLNFKKARLERIVDSVVNELSPIAQKRGLELKYKIAKKLLPKIKIDEEKIRQVIINLLDNAIKYTEKGSIVIDLSRAGNKIHFCVTDTGMGIGRNEFPSLFKKFSRGKGTFLIDTAGNGLGLYVGKMMIEAHHGKIWAESEGEGKGSKFCFDLPVKNGK